MVAPLSWYQYNHADISLEFRIDDLDAFFDLGNALSQPFTTDTFGPGWSIRCWPAKTSDPNKDTISCRLYVGPKGYPNPVFCSFIGRSATSGHCYFEHSATYVFDPDQPSWSDTKPHGTVCQKSPFSAKRLSYRFRRLREEDALVITVNIRTQAAVVNSKTPSDAPMAEAGFRLIHSLITAEEPCNRRFVAFLSRGLIGPRVSLCSQDVLQAKCPELHQWMDNSNHHAVVGTLAHLFHKQDSDECDVYSSAPRLGSNIDYDSDSDFEEDDVEDQDLHASGPNNGVQVLGPGSSSRSNEDEQPDMGVHLPTLDSVKTQTPRAGTDTSKSIANADLSEPCSYSSRSIVTLGLSDNGAEYSEIESLSGLSLSVEEERCDPVYDTILSKATSAKVPRSTGTPSQVVRVDRMMPTTIVTGFAASTWEAFLFYLYTGAIVFAPLTSTGEEARKAFKARYRARNPHHPVPCSCKSIYRLANQLGMSDLEDLALKEIGSQLSVRNIVTEIFTKFTSRNGRVKATEMHFLKQHWDEIKGSSQVAEMLMKVTSGRYPHAAPILTEIWQSVSIVAA